MTPETAVSGTNKWSIALVNRRTADAVVNVAIPGEGAVTMSRYVYSAGSQPRAEVDPHAVDLLQRLGYRTADLVRRNLLAPHCPIAQYKGFCLSSGFWVAQPRPAERRRRRT